MTDNSDWFFIEDAYQLAEGEKDKEYRDIAMSVADRLSKAFASGKLKSVDSKKAPTIKSTTKSGGKSIGVYIKSFFAKSILDYSDEYTDDLIISFVVANEKDFAERNASANFVKMNDKQGSVKLFFKSRSMIVGKDEASDKKNADWWDKYVIDNAAKLFKDRENSFEHEYIHYLDSMRFKGNWKDYVAKFAKKKGKGMTGKEANDPTELNAYMQQAMAKIDRELEFREGSPLTKKLLGNSAQEFVQNVMKKGYLHSGFWSSLTDENKRKFYKRLAQLWQEKQQTK